MVGLNLQSRESQTLKGILNSFLYFWKISRISYTTLGDQLAYRKQGIFIFRLHTIIFLLYIAKDNLIPTDS